MINENRTLKQQKHFPIKLNDGLRYQICVRFALFYPTRLVMEWLLKAHRISITYQGLQKYRKRKRWIKVIQNIRAHIIEQPQAKEIIQDILKDWLEGERKAFTNHAYELLGNLRADRSQDLDRAGQYQIVGFRLVEKFNETIRNVQKVAERVSMTKSLNSTYS